MGGSGASLLQCSPFSASPRPDHAACFWKSSAPTTRAPFTATTFQPTAHSSETLTSKANTAGLIWFEIFGSCWNIRTRKHKLGPSNFKTDRGKSFLPTIVGKKCLNPDSIVRWSFNGIVFWPDGYWKGRSQATRFQRSGKSNRPFSEGRVFRRWECRSLRFIARLLSIPVRRRCRTDQQPFRAASASLRHRPKNHSRHTQSEGAAISRANVDGHCNMP